MSVVSIWVQGGMYTQRCFSEPSDQSTYETSKGRTYSASVPAAMSE
jgi:hypothetical protein